MKDLGHLLRLADPLRHEPVRFDDERARIRSTVLDSLRSAPSHPRRALHFAPLLAAGLLIAMALAYWTGTLRVTPVIAQVRFELRLAEDQPVPGLVVSRVQASDRLIYLHPEAVVGNDDIAQAWVVEGGADEFAVGVQFLADGASRLKEASGRHAGHPMAVLIDGRVVMTPTVRSPMGDSATITGSFTRAEAERIANGMTNR